MSGKAQTTEWQKLKEAFEGKHSKKMNAIMDDMDAEEFQVAFFKLAPYVMPKLSLVEPIQEENNELNININYVKSKADEENRIMGGDS